MMPTSLPSSGLKPVRLGPVTELSTIAESHRPQLDFTLPSGVQFWAGVRTASHTGNEVGTSSQQPLVPGDFVRKLDAMQTLAESSGAPSEASFTAMFSAFTSRPLAQNAQDPEFPFQDDVVSLSYEQALRSATRNRSLSPMPLCANSAGDTIPEQRVAQQKRVQSQAADRRPSAHRMRMSSSVTIRLDEAEGKELRARAAEAGLTVSAYLRSCIFEVDDLRTQVKQTLAQMRTAPAPPASVPAIPLQAPSTGWRDRIFPRWTMHRPAAHA